MFLDFVRSFGIVLLVLFVIFIGAKFLELMFAMLKYYKYHNQLIDSNKEFVDCQNLNNDTKAD